MNLKSIFQQLNIIKQCHKYGLGLWQCPQFLFLVMGIIIIISMISTYQIGIHYIVEPEIVALIVIVITIVLLVLSFIITQSFEKLAEAQIMKSEFINIVSHQLRAPLTNLNWTLNFLFSGRADGIKKKQYEYFKIIQENSKRMEELINDLLTISRIEQGTLPLNKKKIGLKEIVQDLILRFKSLAEASNTKIIFRVQENLPMVFTDPSQIKLVIENLLDNAILYIRPVKDEKEKKKGKPGAESSPARGKVEINLREKKGKLLFEIKDNGIGISKDEQRYIFQKFFRARDALRYQTQGSGLGLSIAKGIIEKLGGKIWFKSKEGEGTTFWFTLPLISR